MSEQSSKQHQTSSDRWISEREAAQLTSMSVAWFQRARWEGGGIPFSKIGRAIRYKLADVEAFMASCRIRSTSDKGADEKNAAKPCSLSSKGKVGAHV